MILKIEMKDKIENEEDVFFRVLEIKVIAENDQDRKYLKENDYQEIYIDKEGNLVILI